MKIVIYFLVTFFYINANCQDSIHVEVPVNVLLKKRTQHNFSISPNGKYFVEVVENNVENDIIIIDIDKYRVHHQIPLGKIPVHNIYWLNNNRLIYESLGEINSIDIDGTNASLIVGRLAENKNASMSSLYKSLRYSKVVNLLHNNKNEILIETYDYQGYSKIQRVNIFTGQHITLVNGKKDKIDKHIVDFNGNVKLGIRYDERGSYSYLIKNIETDKWEQLFIHLNEDKIPLKVDANSYLSQNISFEGFGYSPDIIYLTTNHDSNTRKLVSYNLTETKIESVLLEDIECDINDPHGLGFNLFYDSLNSNLGGVLYQSTVPKYRWFSNDLRILYEKLRLKYSQFFNEIIDHDISNKRFLVYQWSDTSEGNIGVYDVDKDEYYVMFHFNEELDKYKLSKTRVFKIKSRDNQDIPCYLNLPEYYEKGDSLPLVVIPHGGPWSRDYWRLDEFSQYFANRGYAALRVNFRGSTGYGKRHLLSGIKSIDKVMINDIADATKFVVEKMNVNKDKVFLFGHSYGGYATYMSLIKYPEIYAKGVALSAPSNLKDWMKTQKKEKNYFAYEFWNTALGSNSSKYLNEISPLSHAKDLKKPILIFHGKKDEIISVEQAEAMKRELKKYDYEVKLEIMKNEGHSILNSNSLGYILDSAKDFFQKE